MLGFDDEPQGDPLNPDNALNGKILAALSSWSADYKTRRLDLAWNVLNMLLKHTSRTHGLAAYIEFLELASESMKDEASALREVINEDFKKQLN